MKTSEPFYELIRRVRDQQATDEEHARLEELLEQSAELRVAYLRYLNIDLALEGLPPRDAPLISLDSRGTLPFATSQLWYPVLGLLVGIILTALVLPHFITSRPTPNYVATLIAEESCEWNDGAKLQEGQRIAEGTLGLRSGAAVIRFDGGALMYMRGDVSIELRSRSQATLRAGRVIVKAEDQAAGFLLDTPASRVVDLGTEFAVNVERSGATEVHVMDGLVSYSQANAESAAQAPEEILLTAGRAVRFEFPGEGKAEEISFRASRFDEALENVFSQPVEPLLACEPFNYEGREIALDQTYGGMGWYGPWQPARTFPRPIDPLRPLRLNADQLGVGKKLLDASHGFPQVSRRLIEPIRLDRDGIYYFSALVQWQPGDLKSNHMRQIRITLRSSEEPRQSRYTMNLPSCLLPQVQRQDLEVFTSSKKVKAGDLQRWVLKIVARQHEPDELHFRVFQQGEDPGQIEPAWWHVSLTDKSPTRVLDQVILDTYLLPDVAAFGDIRLGHSWRSVTQ